MSDQPKIIYLTGEANSLHIEDVINIAANRHQYKVDFPPAVKEKLKTQREKLETQIAERPDIAIYGTNRLHGDLKDKIVPNELILEYQKKYIDVHNCGTGKPLAEEVVRAMMIIRLNSFAKGMSGMKLDTCQLMIDMLNEGVTPWILEEGSVGASGDLVPLAMLAAVLIGLPAAKAYYDGELIDGADNALQKAGLSPVVLGAKEAIGLTNGTNFIAGLATFAIRDVDLILKNASITMALSLEAIRGEKKAYSKLINEDSHRHHGQVRIAQQIRNLIQNSKRTSIDAQTSEFNGKVLTERVQDRYSFRCAPQVHGAAFEAWEKLKNTMEVEINAATDNPLFDFDDTDERTGGILFASGGNFHGQALAVVIDYLKLALTAVGLITDKRTFSLLDKRLNYDLPSNLAFDCKAADGGLMILQYAGAARAAENKVLATPSSITSLTTSAGQEDFVSMGSNGVLHLHKVIYNTQILVAIELLCALRALQLTYQDLPENLRSLGVGTQKIYDFLCQENNFPCGNGEDKNAFLKDHYLRTDMEKATAMVKSGVLVELVEGLLL